jgi:N-acetylglucosaminyldiphosphoundecaprenol N-acetyl-beta-D-mannosaminyltransferase
VEFHEVHKPLTGADCAVQPPDRIRLGRLSFDALTLDEASDWIVNQATRSKSCTVLTANIHHVRLSERDPKFMYAARRATLSVADGWPIVAATRLLRRGLPERVPGIDIVARVLERAPGLRVAVLGGPPGTARLLAESISGRHRVVLVDPLPKGEWDLSDPSIDELRSTLNEVKPNLTLIGIGAPNQEILADRLRDSVAGPIIGCGAAIEVLAGARCRAPSALRRCGLEWLFRMMLEPRRLTGRYAKAGVVFVSVVLSEVADSVVAILVGR